MSKSYQIRPYSLTALALLPAALCAQNAPQAESEKPNSESPDIKYPNVVWIMADDLGIGDLGCYGQRIIHTPAIDDLASQGMKFMQHYSGSTVSAPSRCSLLTGYHMGHAQIRANAKVPGDDGLLYETPLAGDAVTVADLFQLRHYTTACCGKWGLGGPGTEGEPLRHGFDTFYGYLGQKFAHNYYPEFLHHDREKVMLDGKHYSHNLILDHALDFIRTNADGPFFLYYSPTIPHADLDVPEDERSNYEGQFCETPYVGNPNGYKSQDEPRATYAAMVSLLDKSVAAITSLLDSLHLADNTIVVFTSDNGVHAEGGHDPYYFDSNGPWRGTKRDLYEGGVRTPFVIRWPGHIPEGVTTSHIAAFWDFFPTVAELLDINEKEISALQDQHANIALGAGNSNASNDQTVSKLLPRDEQSINKFLPRDGISYLPTLLGKSGQREHSSIYYEFYEQGGKQSILEADGWKLIRLHAFDANQAPEEELYNLALDPSESTNLIHQYPDVAARLRLLLEASRIPLPEGK